MSSLGNDTTDVVGVICIDKSGRVLLVQGTSGKWSFPKGRRKENETSHDGAMREALEEAGINLSQMPCMLSMKLRFGTYYLYYMGVDAENVILANPLTPEEIKQVKWVYAKSPMFRKEDKNSDLRAYISTTSWLEPMIAVAASQ